MADRLPPIPLPAPNEQPPSPKKSPFSKDPRAQSALHSRATSSGSIFALSESALRRQQSLPPSSSSLDTSRRESVAWSDVTLPLARSRPLEEIGRQLAKIDLESKTRVEKVNELQRQLDRLSQSENPWVQQANARQAEREPPGSSWGSEQASNRERRGSAFNDAALIVHERVVIVTPRVLINQSPASPPETDQKSSEDTPLPSFKEAQALARLAEQFPPLKPYSSSQVTVTDEDTHTHVELDFDTPTPPNELTGNSEQAPKLKSSDSEDVFEEDSSSNKGSPVSTTARSPTRGNSPIGGRRRESLPKLEDKHESVSIAKAAGKVEKIVKTVNKIQKLVKARSFEVQPSSGGGVPEPPIVHSDKVEANKALQEGNKSVRSSAKHNRSRRFSSFSDEIEKVSYHVGKPEGANFSDSEDDEKYLEELSKSMRGRSPRRTRSPSLERPSWGFGNSRVPSRQDVYLDNERAPSRARSHSRARSKSRSRMHSRSRSRNADPYASTGLSYDEVVKTSLLGNNLMPDGKKLTRQESRISMRSNVSSRWRQDLENFRALKVTIYKNGDQWFEGFELRFRPSKDYQDLDQLLHRISPRIDFTTSVTHMFDTDGNRVRKLDDIEDGQSYVASNTRRFFPANYGRIGDQFFIENIKTRLGLLNSRRKRSGSSKSSSSDGKPGSADGKVIKIVNNEEPTINEKVLLNLKTTQTFEEVVRDLGQVLKISGADRIYTAHGEEVKSFSHLRNDFSDQDVFVISAGPTRISRSVSRLARTSSEPSMGRVRTRSKSRNKAPDYGLRDIDSAGNIKILINGARKIYHAPEGVIQNNAAPSNQLGLEWVYGYRGVDRTNNLIVLDKGELVYFLGAVVVIYNRMEERQRHYQGHTQDLTCMELHPGGELVVSGQEEGDGGGLERSAHARVWNVYTMETLAVLGLGECQGAVSGVSFSILNKGLFVAIVDASKEKIISVWDWAKTELAGKVAINTTTIVGVSFHPFDSNLLITYGAGGHLSFWNRKKDGFFARADVGEATPGLVYNCVAFLDSGDLVAGDNEGALSTYTVSNDGEYFKSQTIKAHEKGVSALLALGEGTVLSAGAQDRRLVGWDSGQDFKLLTETELPSSAGSGRVLHVQWPGRSDGNVYIGTTKNLILEGSLQRKFSMVVFGHTRQLPALATHPTDASFVTAGTDKIVAMWRRSKLIWKLVVQTEPASICYHPKGSVVAVGTSDGHMVIISADNGVHVTTMRVCGAAISSIKFNPDGDMIAAASTNGSIYLFKVSRDGNAYKKAGKMSDGQQLGEVDWDREGEFLQTSSKDFNLQFWNGSSFKVEKVPSMLREKEWVDSTVLVGWSSAGIWGNHNYPGPLTPTSVHAAPSAGLLASGDSEGCLRLFSHPCTSQKAEFHQQRLVSGPVHAVRFFWDASYLLASGGQQGAVFKFRLK